MFWQKFGFFLPLIFCYKNNCTMTNFIHISFCMCSKYILCLCIYVFVCVYIYIYIYTQYIFSSLSSLHGFLEHVHVISFYKYLHILNLMWHEHFTSFSIWWFFLVTCNPNYFIWIMCIWIWQEFIVHKTFRHGLSDFLFKAVSLIIFIMDDFYIT